MSNGMLLDDLFWDAERRLPLQAAQGVLRAVAPFDALFGPLPGGGLSSSGPQVARCEAQWAAELGRAAATGWRSASAAYEAVLAEAQIGAGAEVIVPATAPSEAVLALVRRGATPVAVDLDSDSRSLSAALVRPLLTARTRALICAERPHGTAPAELSALAQEHRLLRIGRLGCCALRQRADEPTVDRTVLTFEDRRRTAGAALVLLDDAAAERRLREWRNADRERGMTNLQAVSVLDEAQQRAQLLARRQHITALYRDCLAQAPALLQAGAVLRDDDGRDELLLELPPTGRLSAAALHHAVTARGFSVRLPLPPLHRRPLLRRLGLFAALQAPQADALCAVQLLLPAGPTVGEELVLSLTAALERAATELG